MSNTNTCSCCRGTGKVRIEFTPVPMWVSCRRCRVEKKPFGKKSTEKSAQERSA